MSMSQITKLVVQGEISLIVISIWQIHILEKEEERKGKKLRGKLKETVLLDLEVDQRRSRNKARVQKIRKIKNKKLNKLKKKRKKFINKFHQKPMMCLLFTKQSVRKKSKLNNLPKQFPKNNKMIQALNKVLILVLFKVNKYDVNQLIII